ncbi:TioE family transcriptional regulator [Cohnella zeiphila]|uniref:MerR family transcriptional regulator n=1 Tax=Cohnella zeiphila TaxID=2761120 RepID=A0A7X0STD0_9BACL|nr:TioE family transcriptional regulator [Cohnella zeiphila]MBB6735641.1 MerR family transcriptional regulator [Cohnella zeiphila]
MRYYKPIEIARELGVSTSALRHYEAWGVVPAPERSASGYRQYTHVHFAYFRCLRSLFAGFGVSVACQALRHMSGGDPDAAFWLIGREQAQLQQERAAADQTVALLSDPQLPLAPSRKLKARMTIGEAAELTNVRTSAIRHWEREGLLIPERDPENGYRLFTPTHIRQILLIRTLRRTVYFLDHIKDLVRSLEHQNVEQARKVAKDALRRINERNRMQFEGVYELVALSHVLERP